MPVLTRMPKQRVKTQVVCLAPGAVPAAMLRQNGVLTDAEFQNKKAQLLEKM